MSKKLVFGFSFLFTVIGILITQNEIYADEWIIEAAADGLFGKDNISYLGLCSNFIITGLIRLLSLTSIRLAWIYIIMVLLNFLASYIICRFIIKEFGGIIGIVLSFAFLLCITPVLYFQFFLHLQEHMWFLVELSVCLIMCLIQKIGSFLF